MKWTKPNGVEFEAQDRKSTYDALLKQGATPEHTLTKDGKRMGRPVGVKNKRLDDDKPTEPVPADNNPVKITATADVQTESVSALELNIKAPE